MFDKAQDYFDGKHWSAYPLQKVNIQEENNFFIFLSPLNKTIFTTCTSRQDHLMSNVLYNDKFQNKIQIAVSYLKVTHTYIHSMKGERKLN